jgi:hypothetical protein
VRSSSRLAGAGLVFLWLSMVGAVFLIFDVVLGTGPGIAAGGALAVAFCLVWYAIPLGTKVRAEPDRPTR